MSTQVEATADAGESVCCAYDGSVNAHWVARYAITFARARPGRRLRLVHVEDRHLSGTLLERKLEHVLDDCARADVRASVHRVRADDGVADAVLSALPGDPDTVLLCGTRARPRRAALLRDTVAAELLSRAPCAVLALRVVSPGLLGAPRRLLLPIAGQPGEGSELVPFVRPFADTLEELDLLRVMLLDEAAERRARAERLAALRAQGRHDLDTAEGALREDLDLARTHVDAFVRIAESWARMALVIAGQHRSGLVLAGRPEAPGTRGGEEIEHLLARTPCDVGVYRAAP